MAKALVALVVVCMAIWGFIALALDLRRGGRLTGGLLLATYARELGQVPRTLWIATKTTFHNPWPFGGRVHGWIILIPFLFMFTLTVAFSDIFCDCREPVLLIPLGLFVWVGWGLVLVRDVRKSGELDRR